MGVKINSLVKWKALGSRQTSAAKDAIDKLEEFSFGEGEVIKHVWKDIPEKEALQVKVEIISLTEAFEKRLPYDAKEIQKLFNLITNRAFEKGKQKAKEALEERISKALLNGAGPAHKMTAIDHALPPLRLTIEKQVTTGPHPRNKCYITDPIEVAIEHSEPWAKEWGANFEGFQNQIAKYFKQLRQDSLESAVQFAERMDASASRVRAALIFQLFNSNRKRCSASKADGKLARQRFEPAGNAVQAIRCLFNHPDTGHA